MITTNAGTPIGDWNTKIKGIIKTKRISYDVTDVEKVCVSSVLFFLKYLQNKKNTTVNDSMTTTNVEMKRTLEQFMKRIPRLFWLQCLKTLL